MNGKRKTLAQEIRWVASEWLKWALDMPAKGAKEAFRGRADAKVALKTATSAKKR
jgi:hypothetical protein